MVPPIRKRIFVVGAPRSGTTLVQSLLASHSEVTSFTESHFFARHFARIPLVATPILVRNPQIRAREFLLENGVPPDRVTALLATSGLTATGKGPPLMRTSQVARQLLQLLDELAHERQHLQWIEKTPRHLRYVPFLDRLSRDVCPTHFVHVVRQGLDLVASLHLASQHWERPYDVDACIRRWNEDVGFSLGRVDSPVDHFVFYEDLTTDPENVLRALLSKLDLGWQPEMIEHLAETSPTLITDAEIWKRNLGNSVDRARTSAHRLTAEERDRAVAKLDQGLYERLRAASQAPCEGMSRLAG